MVRMAACGLRLLWKDSALHVVLDMLMLVVVVGHQPLAVLLKTWLQCGGVEAGREGVQERGVTRRAAKGDSGSNVVKLDPGVRPLLG